MSLEFQAWPSTPRLNRNIVITEKLDGTNAAVLISPVEDWSPSPQCLAVVSIDGIPHEVGAQSRKNLLTLEKDNFKFASWVHDHANQLALALGPGRHFGEWWGSGIQRGYGFKGGEKFFSLFNVGVHGDKDFKQFGLDNVSAVPVLAQDVPFTTNIIESVMQELKWYGSRAVPGYLNPEGLVVWHEAGRNLYKYLCENDSVPKSLVGAS